MTLPTPRRATRHGHLRPSLARLVVLACLGAAPAARPLAAQPATDERARVIAVADSALAAITRGDQVALTDLMTPEAQTVIAMPDSTGGRYRVRTYAENRSRPIRGVVERGWSPTAQVSGPIAVVWYPYDLYVNGAWSHCGVDVFTLVRQGPAWRIATLAYSIEQPPACARHPAGPPK